MRFSAILSLLLIGGVSTSVLPFDWALERTTILPSISAPVWAQESGAEAATSANEAPVNAASNASTKEAAPARRDVETVVPASDERAPAGAPIAFEKRNGAFLGADWLADFATPPREFRPLQIVHGQDLTDIKTVEYYRDQCGLGGLVVNVGGAGYVREQANWDRFVAGLENVKEAGMRAWIYDEDGYPSLSAGGVVMEGRPELCSQELAFDRAAAEPFVVRDCYEFTHSSNNVFAARKYPNPLNRAATERFLDVTHRRYRAETGPELFDYVEAFFTDEPSMMAVNLGEIQEDIRRGVRTLDPLDPNKKKLPVVPWCDDLEERYREKYGAELRPNLRSLFEGDSDADRAVRRNFWTLVGELDVERFYKPLQDFCRENKGGPVASGHTLYEENIALHVPLDGNKLAVLKTFDLPGLDMLNSDPHAYFWGCWLAAAFPASAAEFIGQRRVMTEVCDFSQIHAGHRKPCDLAMMEATATWQAAFGVTEYTLYYGINGGEKAPERNEASHRDYCRYVGRLNAVLRDAAPVRPVLLYYPIEELQAEYRPIAEKFEIATQNEKTRQIFDSFNQLGEALSRAQISFYVVDRATLRSLTKNPENAEEAARLAGKFKGVIFPRWSEKIEYDWADPNFRELWIADENPICRWEQIRPATADFAGERLVAEPANPDLIAGTFEREGRTIFVVSNPTTNDWRGSFRLAGADGVEFASERWTALDPKTGAVETFATDGGAFPAELGGRRTLIFVSPARK
ncbi:MAG: hypothetical protein J6K25_13155 [Thermoguttaceae bacterium]|nr:hypothetical protein [Thermoguttaceae bacterium]